MPKAEKWTKERIVGTFTERIRRLMGFILENIPLDKEMRSIKTRAGVEIVIDAINVNSEKVFSVFYENIHLPYSRQILDDNVDFFRNLDLNAVTENGTVRSYLESIKYMYEKTPANNQEIVGKYVKILCKLCNMYRA